MAVPSVRHLDSETVIDYPMRIRPLSLKDANRFIAFYHRHHKPVQGHIFSLGSFLGDGIFEDECLGVATVGRPVSRELDPKRIVEVTRLCTMGDRNVCSFLYSACARTAREMGYEHIQTYILEEEPGTSLRAVGWEYLRSTTGGDWNHSKSNQGTRRTDQPQGPKQCWGRKL